MAKTQDDASLPQFGAEIVDRLASAYGADNLTALATAMGQPPTTVKNWRYRGGVPLPYLVEAARHTRRTLDWLVMGRAPQFESRTEYATVQGAIALGVREPEARAWLSGGGGSVSSDTARTGGDPSKPAPGEHVINALLPVTGGSESRPLVLSVALGEAGTQLDYEVIPKLCGATNGPGSAALEPLQLDRAGEVALTYDWLQRHLGHTTGNLASVRVIGDSMQPTLLEGDTIIIDRGANELSVDAIYVVHMLGQRLVKRVQRKFDGSVVIISDNAAYERETVPRGRVSELEVLGRMVWPRVR